MTHEMKTTAVLVKVIYAYDTSSHAYGFTHTHIHIKLMTDDASLRHVFLISTGRKVLS